MNNMWKIACAAVIVLIVTIVLLVTLNSSEAKSVSGIECVEITDCPELYELLKQKPLSPGSIEFIRSSSCGFVGNVEKVWCTRMTNDTEDNNIEEAKFNSRGRKKSRPQNRTFWNDIPVEYADDSKPGQQHLLQKLNKCGHISDSERVHGGDSTALDEYPWLALLKYRHPKSNNLFFACGGSLINERYVLTAAHCITRIGSPEMVVLGEYNTTTLEDCLPLSTGGEECAPPTQELNVTKVIVHKDWVVSEGKSFYHDIALIRLAEPAILTDFVHPVCLPDIGFELPPNVNLVAAGFGLTEEYLPSEVKLQVSLPQVPRTNCSRTLRRTIKSGQLCAGGVKGKDTCKGDSGGPLMYLDEDARWKAVGVVSIGNKECALRNIPAIYTYVPEYLKWIFSNMEP